MSTNPKQPEVGDLVIDASDLASVLVDLAPGEMVGMRSRQPGCDEALAEIRGNQPIHGAQAGIRDEDIVTIDATLARITEIDHLLPAARKLAELLTETRATLDDRIQRHIAMIAEAVERRAKVERSDDLLAYYESTRAYRSAIGRKAVRTRLRNQAEREASAPLGDE